MIWWTCGGRFRRSDVTGFASSKTMACMVSSAVSRLNGRSPVTIS
jgi:hypothetical protein